jgi:hypothetical protein
MTDHSCLYAIYGGLENLLVLTATDTVAALDESWISAYVAMAASTEGETYTHAIARKGETE